MSGTDRRSASENCEPMNIVELSVKRPVLMTMVIMFLMVVGGYTSTLIPLDMIPKVDFPVVTVTTVYPGAGPMEVESLICKPIEDSVVSINGIDVLQSESNEGYGNVIIRFEEYVDVDTAAADVREKVGAVRSSLPDEAREPIITKFDINALPIMNLSVSSPDRPVESVYALARDFIRDELTRVKGVASITFIGARDREIEIHVTRETLEAYGLSIMALSGLIAQKSLNVPSGHITHARREYILRMDGEFKSVADIEAIEIPLPGGRKVSLSDIAEVMDTYAEKRQGVRLDDAEGVGMVIQKRSDANTTETAVLLRKEIERLREKLPSDIRIDITRDRSIFIADSVKDLYGNLLTGVAITAVILYMFLHSFKGMFIAAVSIPASIIATYSLIYFSGFTINVMTLMALAISVGILVNNAIIVLENIFNHIAMGKDPETAAIEGTNEIMVPVAGATLTNVVVFVPIAFMEGMVGKMFYEFGLTVTFATFISLLVAFTMTPMLAAKFMKPSDTDPGVKGFFGRTWDRAYGWLDAEYGRVLVFVMGHRGALAIGSIALLVGSFLLAPHIGFEFITEPDQREFDITIKRAPGTSLASTSETLRVIEEILKSTPHIKSIYTKLGKADGLLSGSSEGANLGEISVRLDKEPGYRTDDVINSLYPRMAAIPDIEANIRKSGIMGTQESPLQIDVTGADMDRLRNISVIIAENLRGIRGASDVTTSLVEGKPELKVVPKRDKLRLYGLSEAYVAMTLRGCIEGTVATVYREGDKEYDIRVQLDSGFRADIQNMREMSVVTPNGARVSLMEVADIIETSGPTQIRRKDRSRMVKISANVVGRSLGEVVEDAKAFTGSLDLPAGCSIAYSGTVKMMQDSFKSLLTSMIMAVLFTYMLLAALLESFVHPLTILVSFPLSFIGILLGLFLTGKTLSIFSLMAVVMLVGIVVNNGILMIEQIRLLRDGGMGCFEAVIKGCPQKLRPIIMTAAAAIGAMVPLAIGAGAGGEMRAPMAIVSIGGLLVSTVLSCLVIPVVYQTVEGLKGE